MKKYSSWILMSSILMILLICFPSLVNAQGGPGGDPDALPVDGGISILAAAGVAYSVKKIKEHRKKKEDLMKKESEDTK